MDEQLEAVTRKVDHAVQCLEHAHDGVAPAASVGREDVVHCRVVAHDVSLPRARARKDLANPQALAERVKLERCQPLRLCAFARTICSSTPSSCSAGIGFVSDAAPNCGGQGTSRGSALPKWIASRLSDCIA